MKKHQIYREMVIRLMPEQHSALRELALTSGESMANLIRTAVDNLIEEQRDKTLLGGNLWQNKQTTGNQN